MINHPLFEQRSNLLFICLLLLSMACSKSTEPVTAHKKNPSKPVHSIASIGFLGDTSNVEAPGKGGFLLMGGGTDVDAAFKWMIRQAGGGDFVVIRATGTDAYNPYIFNMGGINSIETLKINSRSLANNSAVVQTIRNAEALFIAGGDQSDYINFWKNTDLASAINYLIKTKNAPVGGTSAGCAVLGEYSFSALRGTIYSKEALQNPFDAKITLQKGGFIHIPLMQHAITGQHYLTRNRIGRHITFMARIAAESDALVRGIGVDEKTAVAVDSAGMAQILGESEALFLRQTEASGDPEVIKENSPLTWNRNKRAVSVYSIHHNATGGAQFNLKKWKPQNDVNKFYYYVQDGHLRKTNPERSTVL